MKKSIRRILKEETSDYTDIIKHILDNTIMQDHVDIICDIEVKHPNKIEVLKKQNPYTNYKVIVTFIGGYGTKYFPKTMKINAMYDDILTKMWEIIYDYTGITTLIHYKTTKECDRVSYV